MTERTTIDRNPLLATQALALVPFINELIGEGHILVGDHLSIAPHICGDPRFEWVVPSCRVPRDAQ